MDFKKPGTDRSTRDGGSRCRTSSTGQRSGTEHAREAARRSTHSHRQRQRQRHHGKHTTDHQAEARSPPDTQPPPAPRSEAPSLAPHACQGIFPALTSVRCQWRQSSERGDEAHRTCTPSNRARGLAARVGPNRRRAGTVGRSSAAEVGPELEWLGRSWGPEAERGPGQPSEGPNPQVETRPECSVKGSLIARTRTEQPGEGPDHQPHQSRNKARLRPLAVRSPTRRGLRSDGSRARNARRR